MIAALLLILLLLIVVAGAVIGTLHLVAVDGYRREPSRTDRARCP
ncbi:hypothetical protein SAMN05216488_2200 [Microbacterium sp. LKL04]|nr:hypothetical protein [Microbacterium sp. LKL04]SCY53624.1 hypothetical protein SAMN05216488_2200 [Microbacterium sp. LKL04]